MALSSCMTVEVGAYEVNCSILAFGSSAYLVDPGAEPERLSAVLKGKGLVPKAILLTHAHFDHIGAIPALQKLYPFLPVYLGAGDVPVLTHPRNQSWPDYPPVGNLAEVRVLDEKAKAELGAAIGVRVIETPGHSPGGVCYHFPSDALLLSGDTLFAGCVGRTDFPGGDAQTLMASLEKLKALPDDTRVVPGHGCQTTIAAERAGNPFLRGSVL